MGTLVGHVAPGLGFFLIGLWHLFNHIKLHVLNPNTYTSPPWFSTSKFKYLELILIMAASAASISMELFIGPERHQPFDPDGTIPSNHLHNFEHSSISMTFFLYAGLAIILDKIDSTEAKHGLTQLVGAIAFGQQLLLFHLHSADHSGPEGQYHLLLQILILISLSTTLLGIPFPKSFLLSFMRSLSIFFQGLWLIHMGFMLWTPGLIPKGCFINEEEGHQVVRCSDHNSLHRANSLVNIQFSWFIIAVTLLAFSFYFLLHNLYAQNNDKYFALENHDEDGEGEKSNDDVESQKRSILGNPNPRSFIHVGKTFSALDIESGTMNGFWLYQRGKGARTINPKRWVKENNVMVEWAMQVRLVKQKQTGEFYCVKEEAQGHKGKQPNKRDERMNENHVLPSQHNYSLQASHEAG
ncbi:hypothetical protein VNO77_01670 [Canavalia gladiata]|uniref:Transmembrane protein 45A-like n=1 Tax=Canavalia gladiata TaxID=3824 RepID=A0AAN9MWU2_CANGL